jgi:Uma2 family endonuclease
VTQAELDEDAAAVTRDLQTLKVARIESALNKLRRSCYARFVMVEPKPRRATYQDVIDAPSHKIAEIIDGELRLSPRPTPIHTVVASTLGEELGPPFHRGRGGPGGWIILDEPELHLGEDVVVPDLAGWRRERMPSVDDTIKYFTLAPDWICEVQSSSTQKWDRAFKLPVYAAAGISHAWLIHPRNRTLEVFKLLEGRWLLLAVHYDDQRVRAEPFDAIELDLSVLWADLTKLPTHASEGGLSYGGLTLDEPTW